MFDLIGIFDFNSSEPPTLLFESLPSLKWGQVNLPVQSVKGQGLTAKFVEYKPDGVSYSVMDGLHLFVIGEARLRSDAVLSTTDLKPKNCPLLSANTLMAIYQADPNGFIHQLKGNFTPVIVNERLQQITLYNSRFGISPFYYTLDGQQFLFSTSLAAIVQNLTRVPELDLAAITELAMFNYPLGNRTYFRQIKILRPAEKIIANTAGVRAWNYWDVKTLYDAKLLPEKDALEIGASLFHKTVNDLSADMPRIRVSFTSGFDSRAILSVLEKPLSDYLSYSFGIPGSLNITIPQKIAHELGFSYQPVILNSNYESAFDKYAQRAVMLSDCLSTVERANYPYAFEKLADFSPVVITGLFGSELLRTFQNVGYIVSSGLIRLNGSPDPMAELQKIINESNSIRYFAQEALYKSWDEVEADVQVGFAEPFKKLLSDRRFYMFLLTEGLRKYFGAEIHMERPYGVNRTPFLDDEFVEFLFQAPFSGVYSRALRPTIRNRYRSQYFYAYIIRKYRPDLLDAATDHGYSPRDVVSPFGLLKIAPKHLYWRWKRRQIDYREFKTEEWTEVLYKRRLFAKPVRDNLFSRRFEEDFKNGEWKANRLEFAKAASLKLWLEELNFI